MGEAPDASGVRFAAPDACDIAPRWCRVWRYVHNRDRSPANAAFLRERIPSGCLSFDARGNVRVSPEAFNA
jgi:hypothetical protein